MVTRVYSYLRFSDPKQASGNSAERQMDYARVWAEQNGAVLDTSLTLRDEGLSAYHQRHIKKGALGVFLRAIDEGRIEHGSVLVVEGLDRLSRAEPIIAQGQLAQVVNAGITVVTAADNKVYNREKLRANPMDLIYSLIVMIRAHEESETKSKRVSAAIRRQCIKWQEGTFRGRIRNGSDPSWLNWDGNKFVEIPERANAMRRAIELYIEGIGFDIACKMMGEEGYDTSVLPTRNAMYQLSERKCLTGTREFTIGDETFLLEGYYPPLIDEAASRRFKEGYSKRRTRPTPSGVTSVLTGLGAITVCGYCGRPIVGRNTTIKRKKTDGTLYRFFDRRLSCSNNYLDQCGANSCNAKQVERAIFEYCSDQFRLDALLTRTEDPSVHLRTALVNVRRKREETEKKIGHLTIAIADGNAPRSVIKMLNDLETSLLEAMNEEREIEGKLFAHSDNVRPASAQAWADLMEGVMNLDTNSRVTARKLVVDTFERIVIYTYGIPRSTDWSSPIDIVLVARGGSSRTLRIDRHSGERINRDDYAPELKDAS